MHSRFGFLSYEISHIIRQRFNKKAESIGLTHAQWRALVHLSTHQNCRQIDLAERLQDWLGNIRGDVLAGYRGGAGADSGGHRVFHHRRGRSQGRAVCLLLHRGGDRLRRRPSRHDLGGHRRDGLLMVTLVKDHGLQYLLAATLLTGVLQIVAGC
jgi:hypothetical protein